MDSPTREITTRKLRDLAPTWASLPGWSVLFDNPGMQRTVDDLQRLGDPSAADGDETLYDRLADRACELVAGLPEAAAVAWLPRPTFHVTVADGLSTVKVETITNRSVRKTWAKRLKGLPGSIADISHELDGRGQSWRDLIDSCAVRIAFALEGAEVRGDAVVAALRPASARDRAVVSDVEVSRTRALSWLSSETGLDLTSEWRPHVTLGYAANRDAGQALTRAVASVGQTLAREIDATLVFHSASLYVFTSMVEFWRR